jgi:hypothetical protein
LDCPLTNPPIGEALADNPLNRLRHEGLIVNAERLALLIAGSLSELTINL